MDEDLTSLTDSGGRKSTAFSVNQYDTQLAKAFQLDCQNLLREFKERENPSFTAFSQQWKAMGFSAVFKNQDNIVGLQIFLENAFFIVKKFLYASDAYIQIGALYLLYGLYHKQPIKEWIKIRLTPEDFYKLEQITEAHKSTRVLEPLFIFTKMRIGGAFQYCYVPQALGIDAHHLRRLDLSADISHQNINKIVGDKGTLRKFRNLIDEDPDYAQFKKTNDEYQKLSQKYKDQLFVFRSEVVDTVNHSYSQLFNVQLEDKPSDEKVKDEFASLMMVKHKALRNTNATYRGEKAVVTAMDLDRPSTSK